MNVKNASFVVFALFFEFLCMSQNVLWLCVALVCQLYDGGWGDSGFGVRVLAQLF